MKIIIAPDSFKESLTSKQAADAIAAGFREVFENAEIITISVADGGEGTASVLIENADGILKTAQVTSPLGNKISAHWGLINEGRSAVIETAAASGLELLSVEERNPLVTTSKGTGELILEALNHGVEHIILGLGGSACNDAGAGLLQALGVKLLNHDNQQIGLGGAEIAQLATIDATAIDPRLGKVQIDIACDVDNPLLGKLGASAVFGPQKGATAQMVIDLECNLKHFAQLVLQSTRIDVTKIAGAGAAGGIGAALLAFTTAELKSGIEIVLEALHIEEHFADTDLVITGEGQIDSQSSGGKVPVGVAKLAKKHNCPVIVLAGAIDTDTDSLKQYGIDAVFSIMPAVLTLNDALDQAAENLQCSSRNIAQVLALDISE